MNEISITYFAQRLNDRIQDKFHRVHKNTKEWMGSGRGRKDGVGKGSPEKCRKHK